MSRNLLVQIIVDLKWPKIDLNMSEMWKNFDAANDKILSKLIFSSYGQKARIHEKIQIDQQRQFLGRGRRRWIRANFHQKGAFGGIAINPDYQAEQCGYHPS